MNAITRAKLDGELSDPWFDEPLLRDALKLAKQQDLKRRRKSPPPARPPVASDPGLANWFEQA